MWKSETYPHPRDLLFLNRLISMFAIASMYNEYNVRKIKIEYEVPYTMSTTMIKDFIFIDIPN